MQGGRNPFFNLGDPFGSLGAFGDQRSLLSNFFGDRDPFNDPFFTSPFGSMSESSVFGLGGSPFMNAPAFGLGGSPFMNVPAFGPGGRPFMDAQASGFLEQQNFQPTRSRGPIIEELNSDDEKEEIAKEQKEAGNEKQENPRKHGRSVKEHFVEDPEDEAEGRKSKQLLSRNDFNRVNNMQSQPQTQSFTFQSSTVTYGGANGAYYTSSTRRSGSDGLSFEERKEANSATGQAAHMVSRGMNQKGHSVNRKLNSDGRVETMQTLHNLDEDELSGFEEKWNGNARKYLPGWNERMNPHDVNGSGSSAIPSRAGWALPSVERSNNSGIMRPGIGDASSLPRPQYAGRIKTDMGNNVGSSSHVRSMEPNLGNKNQARRG